VACHPGKHEVAPPPNVIRREPGAGSSWGATRVPTATVGRIHLAISLTPHGLGSRAPQAQPAGREVQQLIDPEHPLRGGWVTRGGTNEHRRSRVRRQPPTTHAVRAKAITVTVSTPNRTNVPDIVRPLPLSAPSDPRRPACPETAPRSVPAGRDACDSPAPPAGSPATALGPARLSSRR